MQEGKPAREVQIPSDQKQTFKQLQLLTSKPVLYVCNVLENEAASGNIYSEKVEKYAKENKHSAVIISANIEAEVASLDDEEEQKEFLKEIGLKEMGLNRVIEKGYKLLDLLTFFTVGPKEARAWTTYRESTAPQAAGVIHTDFERGFICAETICYDDYVACDGEANAKASGKLRLEGKEYSVKDGDVFHFRFNV